MAVLRGRFSDWAYRGEGNNNLVLCNKKVQIVYRFLKRSSSEVTADEKLHKKMKEKLEKAVSFVERVIRPLLGADLVHPGHVVELSSDFVQEAYRVVQLLKPDYLEDKHLDPLFRYALCLPDLCFLPKRDCRVSQPTFCIEIKPNVGFVHSYSKHRDEPKPLLCRHCLSQRYKVKTGIWKVESGYCPLDLFSGHPEQMKRALLCLFERPQNKLRVFKDGILIHGWKPHSQIPQTSQPRFHHLDYLQNNPRCVDSLIEAVTEALLHTPPDKQSNQSRLPRNLPHIEHIEPCQKNPPSCQYDGCWCLPRGCVLQRVLQCQLLGCVDISDLRGWYHRILSHHATLPNHVIRYIESLRASSAVCVEDSWMDFKEYDEDDGSIEFALQKVKNFLLYMTAKSCSIMVALKPITARAVNLESTNGVSDIVEDRQGNQFKFCISVMDLDPKPLHKIQTYLENEDLYRQQEVLPL